MRCLPDWIYTLLRADTKGADVVTDAVNQANKKLVWEFWRALESADNDIDSVLKRYVHDECRWHGPDPINDIRGREAFASDFWRPLLASFSDLTRETYIFFGGRSNGRIDGSNDGRMWVGGTGLFRGRFVEDYLGIAATGDEVSIRWGDFYRVEDDRIVEVFFLLDFIDLMQQAGIQVLPPSRGIDGMYPPPAAADGILLDAQDDATSEHTLQHIRRFIFEGLNSFDQSDLKSMGMADFFHPDVHWYGPGGIGACLSFQAFTDNHQQPWLHAFPDRRVQDLDALIAEGPYSGGPGWAGVLATHTGRYKDCPATGEPVEFNGLDFWKLENDRYVENWVFVDMIHMFRQLGVDLFERLRAQRSGAEA